MASDDDFAPEDLDDGMDEPDLDFEPDDIDDEDAGPPTPRARADVYTALLILSAIFYIIALAATFGELTWYCTRLPWQQ